MNAIIFHWWNDLIDNVEKDFFNPIILSIACIRYFDKAISIYVIDLSDNYIDWLDYSNKLNFKIIKKSKRFQSHVNFNEKSMSRIWDISEVADYIPEENIIFNDVDVFWIKNPFPLQNSWEKFNCNRNNGVFYFSKNSKLAYKFIELWKERNLLVMYNEYFRDKFYKRIKFPYSFKTHDELVCRSIIEDNPELNTPIHMSENSIIFSPVFNPKNIHFIRAFCGTENRISIILSIKEIKNMIESVLGYDFYGKNIVKKTFSVHEITKRNVIKYLCSFGGNYEKAINYGVGKIC